MPDNRVMTNDEVLRWGNEMQRMEPEGVGISSPTRRIGLKTKTGGKSMPVPVPGMKPSGGQLIPPPPLPPAPPASPPPPPPEAGGEGGGMGPGSPGMLGPSGGGNAPPGGPGPWKGHEWAQKIAEQADPGVRPEVMGLLGKIMKLLSTPGNTGPGPDISA
jgi:hypothetical protein